MEVKCPRCRYRFEMPQTPGVTTLQCFCPRCGQPFSYDLNRTEDSRDEAIMPGTHTSGGSVVPPPVPHNPYGAGPSHAYREGGDKAVAPRREETSRATAGRRQGVFGAPPHVGKPPRGAVVMPPTEKKHGCFHRLMVTALCCVAIVFLAVRYCDSERHYTAQDVNVSDDTSHQRGQAPLDAIQDEEQEADTATAEASSSDEELPSWVEGSWHADTDYGGIDVTISGNTIAETEGDETSKGTFHYRGNTLYCDFGDGETFTYRLDPDKHRIDAGRGVYMDKVR